HRFSIRFKFMLIAVIGGFRNELKSLGAILSNCGKALTMYPHHTQSIQNVTEYFQRDPEVLALLLGGSIAHGFETPTSDVDIMILVSDEDHKKRLETNQLHFFNLELCTYQGGYVDGKYTSLSFLAQVAEKGSEPARFAFSGSQILFSKVDGLAEQLCKA